MEATTFSEIFLMINRAINTPTIVPIASCTAVRRRLTDSATVIAMISNEKINQGVRELVEERDRVLRGGEVVGLENRDLAEVGRERPAERRRERRDRSLTCSVPVTSGNVTRSPRIPCAAAWIC